MFSLLIIVVGPTSPGGPRGPGSPGGPCGPFSPGLCPGGQGEPGSPFNPIERSGQTSVLILP